MNFILNGNLSHRLRPKKTYRSILSLTIALFIFLVFLLQFLMGDGGTLIPFRLFFPKFLSLFLSLFVVSLGVSVVVSIRYFDVSVGSIATLSATVFVYASNLGYVVLPYLSLFLVALLCGTINGTLSYLFKNQAGGLISSLFILFVGQELTMVISGGEVSAYNYSFEPSLLYMFERIMLPIVITIFFVIIFHFYFMKKRWYYYLNAFGKNQKTFSRVSTSGNKIIILAYIASALSAGSAGLITVIADGVVDSYSIAPTLFIDTLMISILAVTLNPMKDRIVYDIFLLSLLFSLAHFFLPMIEISASVIFLIKMSFVLVVAGNMKITTYIKER